MADLTAAQHNDDDDLTKWKIEPSPEDELTKKSLTSGKD